MKQYKKVKILATLGPASSEEHIIQQLHEAGADLFRINMSHASHDMMRQLIRHIRAVELRCGRPIGILADLQGPKLRIGMFKQDSVELKAGQSFTLDNRDEPGDNTRVFLPHPEIFAAVKQGHRLLIDDGKLHLRVEKSDDESITTTVVAGTKISNRKGVSLPDSLLGVGVLTDKDRADLDAVLETGEIDWVALSFVQRPEDLLEVRKIAGNRVGLMSKIEKPQALDHIDEIIALSDALMVARGDLGVEMPLESVPGLQKQLTRACRRAGKPVVIATQMLESMISAPVPTRAEVSDVATAVFEGADAIMLSANRLPVLILSRPLQPWHRLHAMWSAIRFMRALSISKAHRLKQPVPMPFRWQRTRLPLHYNWQPLFVTPHQEQQVCVPRGSARRCRSLHFHLLCKPHAAFPWSGVFIVSLPMIPLIWMRP